MPDCLGPYVGDSSLPDIAQFDFVVLSALDGTKPNPKFNVYLDVAYKLGKPVIATVRVDPSFYTSNTLGMWPLESNDPVYYMLKKMFIMPDGKSRYTSINAVLIDMRTYYDAKGGMYTDTWVVGVVKHVREWLEKFGITTYLLVDNKAVALYPNPAGAVATYLSNERRPIAVQQNEQNNPKLSIPWAQSAFLWWFGSKFVNDIPTAMFRSIMIKEALYQFLGFKPPATNTVTPPPVVVTPPIVITNPSTTDQLLAQINQKLDRILNKIGA